MRTLSGLAAITAAALASAACSDDAPSTTTVAPVTIALITPRSGVLTQVGQHFEIVANLAVAEVNAQGGVSGHPLQLFVVDDHSDITIAHVIYETLADIGVLAVIGPARSGSVADLMKNAAMRHVPVISPSSTDAALANDSDDHYVFRNVSNDNFQGRAIAHYLADLAAPHVTQVVVVHEDSAYGTGLAGSFTSAYTRAGRDGEVTQDIAYTAPLDEAGLATVMAKIEAAAPSEIVLVALEGDALSIVNAWDASGMLPDVKWFFTDGARSMGFLTGAPASLIGSLGTAPTNPDTGAAYGVLVDRYDSVNIDHVADQVYAANVWDAVFLLSAAMVQQAHDFPDEPIGGEHLRDAITSVSRAGQIYNAGQWADLVAAIDSGGDVDYDGASGPCDFDENGEAIGPYEVWQLHADNLGHRSFERTVFLEAQSLE